MARVLIVGCGCRGRELATGLLERGHAVRGTTRGEQALGEIERAGAEGALGDPDRLSTLLPLLAGSSAAVWLMGSASAGRAALGALHGPRLQSFIEKLVDSPVRGLAYEAAGSVPAELLEEGAAIVAAAGETYRMPVRVVDAEPAERDAWLAAHLSAVEEVLSA